MIRGPVTVVLNRIAVVLVITTIILHIGPDLPGAAADFVRAREPAKVVQPSARVPDIYVLLLDGYPRADVLARASASTIVLRSRSNHTFTTLTLASLLQMKVAAFTPQAAGLLADDPTPVNLMAILLNHYLGTQFPMSPDRYFLSPTGARLFPLTEVSDPDSPRP